MEFLSELHPRIVHFPIACFVLYFILETAGVIFKKDFFTKTAMLILVLGILTALISVLTGNQAHVAIKPMLIGNNAFINQLIEQHEKYATLSLWYFFGLFFFRLYVIIRKKFSTKFQYIFVLLGLIGCVLILLAGYYGGALVFDYGLGTKIFIK